MVPVPEVVPGVVADVISGVVPVPDVVPGVVDVTSPVGAPMQNKASVSTLS